MRNPSNHGPVRLCRSRGWALANWASGRYLRSTRAKHQYTAYCWDGELLLREITRNIHMVLLRRSWLMVLRSEVTAEGCKKMTFQHSIVSRLFWVLWRYAVTADEWDLLTLNVVLYLLYLDVCFAPSSSFIAFCFQTSSFFPFCAFQLFRDRR